MTPESRLLAELRLLSTGNVRLFRQNTGLAWTGEIVSRTPDLLMLRNYRPFKSGFSGLADLTGWVTRDGRAVFTAIEAKSPRGRVTPEQAAFIAAVTAAGGVAGICRTVDEARTLLAR